MPEMTSTGFGGHDSIDGLKRIVPWVMLGAMVLVVWSLYGQYKANTAQWDAANSARAGLITTSTALPEAMKAKPAPEKGPWVVMLTAVNFRKEPSASSDTISGFDKGGKVKLITKVGDWYKVKDKKGRVGWVTAEADYTKVVNK